MNFRIIPLPLSLLFLAACGSGDNKPTGSTTVIDIAQAIESPVELKVSDLGSKITYVPFETLDESLIPNYWMLIPTDTHLIVSCISSSGMEDTHSMAFDMNGRFVATIGHVGDDPEAYGSPVPVIGQDDNMYFPKWGATEKLAWVEYDVEGKYLGRYFPDIPVNPQSSQFIDTTLVTVKTFGSLYGDGIHPVVYSGGINGGIDSLIVSQIPGEPEERYRYRGAFINKVPGVMRNTTDSYYEIEESQGEQRHDYSPYRTIQYLWKTDGKLHYRYPMTDTIYAVTPSSFEPIYTFDCGKTALKPENFNHKEFPRDVVLVSEMCETPTMIIFGASRGWMSLEDHQPFVGYFDKTTGRTVATQAGKGFVDDLTNFMPFYPIRSNNRGDLFGIITIEDIQAWQEEHPGVELPEVLRDLNEDSNPICVIVSK